MGRKFISSPTGEVRTLPRVNTPPPEVYFLDEHLALGGVGNSSSGRCFVVVRKPAYAKGAFTLLAKTFYWNDTLYCRKGIRTEDEFLEAYTDCAAVSEAIWFADPEKDLPRLMDLDIDFALAVVGLYRRRWLTRPDFPYSSPHPCPF